MLYLNLWKIPDFWGNKSSAHSNHYLHQNYQGLGSQTSMRKTHLEGFFNTAASLHPWSFWFRSGVGPGEAEFPSSQMMQILLAGADTLRTADQGNLVKMHTNRPHAKSEFLGRGLEMCILTSFQARRALRATIWEPLWQSDRLIWLLRADVSDYSC